jgi:hypothetical protein
VAAPDFVPWHIYERDIKRLSDDIDRLVNKIDGLVESIASLTISQHRDEVNEEHRKESSHKKWTLYLAVFSASLSIVSTIAVAIISRHFI